MKIIQNYKEILKIIKKIIKKKDIVWDRREVGVYKPMFHVLLFLLFQNYKNSIYLQNLMLIFGRCHHSSAMGTPVKYECDSKEIHM